MAFLSANRNDLLASLTMVSGIVDRKHTLEIFANVLLEKKNGQFSMVATDKEIQVTAQIKGVAVDKDEAITVNAKLLQDVLRVLPSGAPVEFLLEDKKLNIRSGKSRYSLQTLPAEEFTRMKENEESGAVFSLKKQELKTLFAHTQYAMGTSEPRQFLNGTLFKIEDKTLAVVATDGHRMALATTPLQNELEPQEIVLPRKTVLELNRLIAGTSGKDSAKAEGEEVVDDSVKISVSGADRKKQVRFELNGIEMISKVLDTNYPDYKPIIPNPEKCKAVFPRTELLATLQRVSVVTNSDNVTRAVHFAFNGGNVVVSTNNQKNEDAQEEMDVAYTGDSPIELVYNLQFLIDMLNNVEGQNIAIAFDDDKTTALVTIEGSDQFKYAVMPVRV